MVPAQGDFPHCCVVSVTSGYSSGTLLEMVSGTPKSELPIVRGVNPIGNYGVGCVLRMKTKALVGD